MAEHGVDGRPVLGFAFDGTGYGPTADWGGEMLLADYDRVQRVGHLADGAAARRRRRVRNPCRTAWPTSGRRRRRWTTTWPGRGPATDGSAVSSDRLERGVACVPTSSMGRLFDAVAALLGVRHRITYEAQAAIELEVLADSGASTARLYAFGAGAGADGRPARSRHRPGPVLAGCVADLPPG